MLADQANVANRYLRAAKRAAQYGHVALTCFAAHAYVHTGAGLLVCSHYVEHVWRQSRLGGYKSRNRFLLYLNDTRVTERQFISIYARHYDLQRKCSETNDKL